jgi:predicted aspartyl protease
MPRYKDPILCVLALSAVFFGGYQFLYKPAVEQIASDAVDATLKQVFNPPPSPSPTPAVVKEGIIPVEVDGGFSYVHIAVNGSKPLVCLIDSGAAILMLDRKQMNYLWDNSFVTKADLLGQTKGYGADGKSFKIVEMNLKRVDIGGMKSTNWTAHAPDVKAAVSPNSDGSCLVGQSFLQRFKAWRVDNDKRELHLEFSAPWLY